MRSRRAKEMLGLGSLGKRLFLAFALVSVTSVLVLTGAALVGVDRGVQVTQDADRQQVTVAVAEAAAAAYREAGGWASADLTPAISLGDAASARVVVRDATGTVLRSSAGAGATSGGPGAGSGAVTQSVVVDGAIVGQVQAVFRPGAASRVLDVAWSWILVAAVVALVVAFAASWLVTRLLVGPLRAMTDAARSFTAGNRQSRAGGRAPGEIGELATAFNGMADEVVRSDRDRRNLTADVAHELRTPLAALQAGLEELRDGFVPPTPERLAALHDQSLRLGRVVADLAELAAVETAGPTFREELVDLAQVAQDELSLHESQLRAAGLRIIDSLSGPLLVRADSDRLHQAVGNLLANAARYCGAGDSVTVALTAEHGRAVLTVSDTGPGIPEEELPFVFDRLWRGRAARQIPGSGIGLALVREIVANNGGTVDATSSAGEGTRVTIRLPMVTTTAAAPG